MQAPLENENPAPLGGGNGVHKNNQSGRTIFHLDNPAGLSAQAFIGKRTDELAFVADWKAELLAKIDRAQMCFELVGLDHHEQDLLADEVKAYKQLCRALMATMATPARMPCAAPRRAA
jgi:hypothetical protein